MKKAKIVATIGPASESPSMLEKIIRAGVDVCRLNFSFGTHAEHLEKIVRIREVARKVGKPVAILQDLQGPKIRVGKLNAPVTVRRGDTLCLTGKETHSSEFILPTTYKSIAKDTEIGKTILLADGKIILKVVEVCKTKSLVKCSVLCGGTILSGKGINLPYTNISLPALTDKDLDDALFGAKVGVDFIGMSFVRRPEDVLKLKAVLKKIHANIPIVAKIEKPEALDNLDAILDEVDGVMVARGDLAVELSFTKVPIAQKQIIHRANEKCKLTIIATEMLSSMVDNPLPTRAEVSDVANGIWDGTDCVMLSNETAMGKYPVESVKAMHDIVLETESAKGIFKRRELLIELLDIPPVAKSSNAICKAAARLSKEDPENPRALLVISHTGETAKMLSKYRPGTTIYTICDSDALCNRLAFYHNVYPVKVDTTERITNDRITEIMLVRHLVKPGDELICLCGLHSAQKWMLQGLSLLTIPKKEKPKDAKK